MTVGIGASNFNLRGDAGADTGALAVDSNLDQSHRKSKLKPPAHRATNDGGREAVAMIKRFRLHHWPPPRHLIEPHAYRRTSLLFL